MASTSGGSAPVALISRMREHIIRLLAGAGERIKPGTRSADVVSEATAFFRRLAVWEQVFFGFICRQI